MNARIVLLYLSPATEVIEWHTIAIKYNCFIHVNMNWFRDNNSIENNIVADIKPPNMIKKRENVVFKLIGCGTFKTERILNSSSQISSTVFK